MKYIQPNLEYLQLKPESETPDISPLNPFRCVVVIDETVTSEWQSHVSVWLVKSGCLYMMAWGNECSTWDDSVDAANLDEFNYKDIPDEKFVMTTWHEKETLKNAFWFSKNCAAHPSVQLANTLILHISNEHKGKELLAIYISA